MALDACCKPLGLMVASPEEYAARLEQERAEEEELMRRLKEEEEEAARKAAQILEEEAALQRCALHTYTHPPPAL